MVSFEEEDFDCPRRRLSQQSSLRKCHKVKKSGGNKARKQKKMFVYSWKSSALLSLSFTGFTSKTKEREQGFVCLHWWLLHFPH